jgi:hypothetical protein
MTAGPEVKHFTELLQRQANAMALGNQDLLEQANRELELFLTKQKDQPLREPLSAAQQVTLNNMLKGNANLAARRRGKVSEALQVLGQQSPTYDPISGTKPLSTPVKKFIA